MNEGINMVSSEYKKRLPMNPTEGKIISMKLLEAIDAMFVSAMFRIKKENEGEPIYVPRCNEEEQ